MTKFGFIIMLIVLFACKKDDGFKGKACFTVENEADLNLILPVKFNNCTEGDYYYLWQFGDNKYAYDKEPSHSYQKTGSYVVTLVIQSEQFTDINADGLVTMDDKTVNSNYKQEVIEIY